MAMLDRALVLASCLVLSSADAFLKSRAEQAREVDKQDVKSLLLSELSGRTDAGIEAYLHPLFASLPKNSLGRLEPPLVRYALNRYFVQRHGWYIKGLDATWLPSESNETLLKARVPAYIQSLFEERLNGQGFGLRELTVFAATVSDLIHAEATTQLESIHKTMGLSTSGPLSRQDADEAVEAFLVAYLLGAWVDFMNGGNPDVKQMKRRLLFQYPDYPETYMWLQDFQKTYTLTQQPRRNPFVERPATFEESTSLVLEFSHHFGAFQNLECHTLKRKLVDMEDSGTGRVRLANFYTNALEGGWEFMESLEYLRNQGALDETDPRRPSVIIPNYINSLANCLTASDFYAVCCLNECNDLMSHVERSVAAPRALPSRIAEVVSHLQSDSVDAPRNLSSALLVRLDQIAEHHDGTIPLHGRLFAQWMHHAYPRECPFPHVSGTISPVSPQEFAKANGASMLEASKTEMEDQVSWINETSVLKELPWALVEEELVDSKQASRRGSSLSTFAAVAALVSFAMPLLRAIRSDARDDCNKHWV